MLQGHSLRNSVDSLPLPLRSTWQVPQDLLVTSATEESNVIMGVRHRKYTLEAVEYYPENVLSEGGDELFASFLKLRGGT